MGAQHGRLAPRIGLAASHSVIIRPETPDDIDEIDAVVEAAFGQPDEAKLVRLLRASDVFVPELSLVAEEEGAVVGHVMISYAMLVSEEDERRVLSLAPLAVRPDRQRDGIGGALTLAALSIADERGEPLVIVLGHPAYYPRFGFERASLHGISPPSQALLEEAFMVKRLSAYDPSYTGRFVYPPAFDET